jgi:hypothetical protein
MSEDEQLQLGKMVNKADAHVKGCMTVAYCAIMVAKLIQGTLSLLAVKLDVIVDLFFFSKSIYS